MAIPAFVKFSRVQGAVFETLQSLGSALAKWNIELNRLGRLRPSGDTYDGGLELVDDDLTPCTTLEDASRLARGSDEFVVSYLARSVLGYLNLYVFDVGADSFSVTLSFDTNLLTSEPDDFAEGEWLRAVLLAIVKALNVEVCGYGRDAAYSVKHESLDPNAILARLREGDLLAIPYPVFHAIALSLIGIAEMESLLKTRPVDRFLKYTVSGAYHVLAAVP